MGTTKKKESTSGQVYGSDLIVPHHGQSHRCDIEDAGGVSLMQRVKAHRPWEGSEEVFVIAGYCAHAR